MRPFPLNDQQTHAVDLLLNFLSDPRKQKFLLKGYAGTGKTTTIQEFAALAGVRIVFTAPTNKATKVLREMNKVSPVPVEAKTIYSLLGLRMDANGEVKTVTAVGENKANNYDVIVVDEGSMVNSSLNQHIDMALLENPRLKVIFMADPLQLPPIGEDESVIFSTIADQYELTKVERHDNQILKLTMEIRAAIIEGRMPVITNDNDDNGGVYCMNKQKLQRYMADAYTSENYELDPGSIKTVAWRNVAVNGYNKFLRDAIYDHPAAAFVEGERVVACQPIPDLMVADSFVMTTDEEATVEVVEVANHPIYKSLKCWKLHMMTDFSADYVTGWVIHPDSQDAYNSLLSDLSSKAKARQGSWGAFWAAKESIMDIRPCHAITAHRSQGSTYETTFVDVKDILSNRNKLEALRCLYVAASRAGRVLCLRTR